MILSFTVTTVTKKRDISPFRATQCSESYPTIYLCSSARGYCPRTGYSGYREPVDRVLGTLGYEREVLRGT
jgi:hypothetical protein